MGSFTFKWPHTAEEVYVTGTFDNWSKSEKLDKVGDVFEKTVTLPDASEKIFYKFVVDGTWTTDHTAPQENDEGGNENNVLKPENIAKVHPAAAAVINTVTPDSTTAALAKDVPLEKKEMAAPAGEILPGTFPETPAAELNKEIKVDPLPAAPGEGIHDRVTLDQESYEKGASLPAGPGFKVPPISGNMIPESSLPIVGSNDATKAHINTVTPTATTVGLAAGVPLEPKVPEVVKESQEKAGVDPEASGVSSEVQEKSEVEKELLEKVPTAPTTSEGTGGEGTTKSEGDKTVTETIAATAAAAGAAALAAVVAAKDSVVAAAGPAVTQAQAAATDAAAKLPDSVKEALPVQAQGAIATQTKETKLEEVSPEVPAEVKESIAESGQSPEAAANTVAVEEKKTVEAELLKEVKPVEPAAAETPAKAAAVSEPAASTTPSSSKAAESPATAEKKKKKNRLSVVFGKIKHSLSGKDKA